MDPSHLLDEATDADSMAAEVKPVVTMTVTESGEQGVSESLLDNSSASSQSAEVPIRMDLVDSEENAPITVAEDQSAVQSLLSEIVALRQAKSNLEEELLDVKEKCRELSTRNSELQSQVASTNEDVNERSRLYRQLESSRNELAMKKMALDCDLERLKHEKEERDAAIRTLTKEKHVLATENFALKEELQRAVNEKSALTQEKNNREQEMRTFLAERERARVESDMYANSRRWFLQEISQKDSKCSELRVEMSSKELSWQRERLCLKDEIARLLLAAEDHESQLAMSKKHADDALKRITELSSEHASVIADLEAELRKERELSSLYKDQLEKAEQVAAEMSEQWKTREHLFEETKQVLATVQEEIEEEKRMRIAEVSLKEEQINGLREELSKANELLKSKHAVHLNVSEEELAVLSPAAVETARLLRGGQSLTSIVREHARLSGELTEARERNRQLEQQLSEVVEEIEERAPQLFHQKDLLDKTFDHNNRLQEQLKEADEARIRLESARDSTTRELAFTRAELEKYQRDYAKASKQVQHLLFVIERERRTIDEDMSDNDEDNARLFDNIAQLQKINRRLESELEAAKTSAEQLVLTSKNAEIESLQRELEASRKTENTLKGELDQMRTTFDLLQTQMEQVKKLAEDNVSVFEARTAKLKAEEATAAAQASEMKVARLEEYIKALKEQKEISERIHSDRLARSEQLLSEAKMTIARLEGSFEMQKQTTEAVEKELERTRKESDQIREENDRLRASDVQMAGKVQQLNQDLMKLQESTSNYKIELRAARDELEHSRLVINRLESEVDSHKRTAFSEQQMMLSFNEMAARLTRIETEKMAHLGSQLETVRVERDSLKTSNARLSDQLSNSRNDAKQAQTRYEEEISLLRLQLGEKEKELALSERQLVDLRARLSNMQAQYTAHESTIGMTPERLQKECQQLKNRSQYLECQVDELKTKLAEAENTAIKKSSENDRMESHSKVMEMNLKQMAELGSMERERLEARASSAETRSEELTVKVAELSNRIIQLDAEKADMEMEHIQKSSQLQLKIDILEAQVKDADATVAEMTHSLNTARGDLERRLEERNELADQINELKSTIADRDAEIMTRDSKLDSKEKELFNAQEKIRVAEENLRTTETTLAARVAEMSDAEVNHRESIKDYEQKVEDLLEKYEKVVSQMSENSSGSVEMKDGNEMPEPSVVESMKTVVEYLREEKQKAVSRSMTAEVEVKRLRAEVAEIRSNRDELSADVQRLRSEAAANADALAEKALLAERLEAMASVQRQNTMYRGENEKLHKVSSELSKQKRELETKLANLTALSNDAQSKITILSSELAAKKKEADLLRQRVAEAALKGDQEVRAELDQCRSKLARVEAEMVKANSQAVEAEKLKNAAEARVKEWMAKHTDTCTKFEATRKLARRYRDENAEDKQKISNLEAEVARLKSQASSSSTVESSSPDVAVLRQRLNSLEEENTKLSNDLTTKIGEFEEVKFRLSAMGPSFEKAQARNAQLSAEKNDLLARIASLEGQISAIMSGNQPRSAASLSASSVMSTGSLPDSIASSGSEKAAASVSTIKRLAFDSPVRYQNPPSVTTSADVISGPVQSSATQSSSTTSAPGASLASQVPKLFKSSSVEPAFPSTQSSTTPTVEESSESHSADASQDAAPTVQVVPSSPVTYSLATSSAPRISPGQSLFGKSAPVAGANVTTSSANSSNEGIGTSGSVITEAEQSSQVSGSAEVQRSEVNDDDAAGHNDSAGESRDSGSGMPVSSSDGRRKRTATNESSTCESKRHRDSPSEVVTSSEERRDIDAVLESGMVAAADMEAMDVPDDAEGGDDIEVVEEGQEDSVQHIELLSDEDVSEQSMDDYDEDEADDGGMESDEEIDNGDGADVVVLSEGEIDGDEIGEVEMDDDHGDDELEGGDDLVISQDDEALAADDNSLDVPAHSGDFVDDDDREAASAVEEADDEGRDTGNNSNAGTSSSIRHAPGSSMTPSNAGGSSQAQGSRLRIPIVYGADDQCSSSNESGTGQFAARRRRPVGVYQVGRSTLSHAAPSSAHQEPQVERMSARMRGRARAALRGRGRGRGSMHQ